MSQLLMVGGAAAFAGVVFGALFGVMYAGRRGRRQMEEIGGEVSRLQSIANQKLTGDDPELKTLLRNLNTAVEQTYRAVDALEEQAEITKRKSEGAKEIMTSSRNIVGLLEDFGADVPAATLPPRESEPVIEAKREPTPPSLR